MQAQENVYQIIKVSVDKASLQLYQADSTLIVKANNVNSAILYAKHVFLILGSALLAGNNLMNFRQEVT